MELKDLVPPLELCKQIPEGKFADSALIWSYDGDFWSVQDRNAVMPYIPENTHPAPTLQEILTVLPSTIMEDHQEYELVILDKRTDYHTLDWQIGYKKRIIWGKKFTAHKKYREHDYHLPSAALRLWLSVTSDKSEKSERDNP